MSLTVHRRDAFSGAPKAVLFDMDNTFYAYDPAHAAGQSAVRLKVEKLLSVKGERFDQAFQEARRQIKEKLGKTASAHSRLLYFQRTIELLGFKTQPLLSLDLEQTYWRRFLDSATLHAGLTDLLDDFRIAGVKMAVVTDLTAQIQFRKLVYFGLDHVFDAVVTSEEAGSDKPHRSPFALALEKLDVLEGSIWMIGDNPVADIQGAKAAVDASTLLKCNAGKGDGKNSVTDLSFDFFEELREFSRDKLVSVSA